MRCSEYTEQHYFEAFTLKHLTYQFGLNDFKLKKGYKELFQQTVFGRIHQLRMKKTQALLQQGLMNVSEAAFSLLATSM